jgi:hypothetical protein
MRIDALLVRGKKPIVQKAGTCIFVESRCNYYNRIKVKWHHGVGPSRVAVEIRGLSVFRMVSKLSRTNGNAGVSAAGLTAEATMKRLPNLESCGDGNCCC